MVSHMASELSAPHQSARSDPKFIFSRHMARHNFISGIYHDTWVITEFKLGESISIRDCLAKSEKGRIHWQSEWGNLGCWKWRQVMKWAQMILGPISRNLGWLSAKWQTTLWGCLEQASSLACCNGLPLLPPCEYLLFFSFVYSLANDILLTKWVIPFLGLNAKIQQYRYLVCQIYSILVFDWGVFSSVKYTQDLH